MKRKYTKLLLTGIFCSYALTANAFDYISKESGFSVNIPDQTIMVVGERIFAAENRIFDMNKQVVKTNGIHIVTCMTADQLQQNFDKNFSTDTFNTDLANIKLSLKAKTKNPLAIDAYKYLHQSVIGASLNDSNDNNDFNGLRKLNEQLSNLTEINKLTVENINGKKALKVESEIKNIGFNLKLPVRQALIQSQAAEKNKENVPDNITEQGVKLDFADDGYLVMHFENLCSIKAITYLLSANDNLYAVTSLYQNTDNIPEIKNLYKLDKKSFIKLNKMLVHNLKFTDGRQQQDNLVIKDNISGRKLSLPPQWLYTQTDLAAMYDINEKGIQLTAYTALPEASLKVTNDAMKNFGVSFDNETTSLNMDLSDFSMPDLLNLIDESVFMLSGNLNNLAQLGPDYAVYSDQYKSIFDMPDLTKIILSQAIINMQSKITPEKAAMIKKYLQTDNFAYTFDINHYNGYFACEADLKIHLPDIFKLMHQDDILTSAGSNSSVPQTAEESRQSAEKLFFSIMNDNLIPFDCYIKNQLYFNRSRHFNNLLYFTKGSKENANKQILQQFNSGDLYIY